MERRRQIYYAANTVENPKLAKEGELLIADTLKPYIGIYCIANGTLLTGATPSPSSKVLTPVIDKHTTVNGSKYYELTRREHSGHTAPKVHIPDPDTEDYDKGQFVRFFIQKINEPEVLIEIDEDQYKEWNVDNKTGPDGHLYNKFDIQWMISGNEAVYVNRKNIKFAENNYPGLENYLSDPAQFVRNSRTEERFYEDGTLINPSLPPAYGNSVITNQLCGNCAFRHNNFCSRWQAGIRNKYWCRSWKMQGESIDIGTKNYYWMYEDTSIDNGTVYYYDANTGEDYAFQNQEEYFDHRSLIGYPRDWSGIVKR
jgi:hypothetical protein